MRNRVEEFSTIRIKLNENKNENKNGNKSVNITLLSCGFQKRTFIGTDTGNSFTGNPVSNHQLIRRLTLTVVELIRQCVPLFGSNISKTALKLFSSRTLYPQENFVCRSSLNVSLRLRFKICLNLSHVIHKNLVCVAPSESNFLAG